MKILLIFLHVRYGRQRVNHGIFKFFCDQLYLNVFFNLRFLKPMFKPELVINR